MPSSPLETSSGPRSVADLASSRGAHWAGAALFFVAAVLVQLFRQPGQRATDTMWAEDGGIYATQVLARPALHTLFLGYGGYAQLVPRLLALGTRVVPLAQLARYDTIAGAVVWALLGLFVHRSTKGLIGSPLLRWLLAAFMVAAPVLSSENSANITNVGWGLVVAAFWAVASDQEGRVDVALRCLVVACAALTTPVTAVVVPMAFVMLLARRRRADLIVFVMTGAMLAVQALAVRATTSTPASASTIDDTVTAYGVRTLAASLFGERWLDDLWFNLGRGLIVLAVVLLVVVVVVSAPSRLSRYRRLVAAGAAATSLVTWLFTAWARGSIGFRLTASHYEFGGARYFLIPGLLLISAILVVAGSSRRPWVTAVVFVWGAGLIVMNLRQPSPRTYGPSWRAGYDEAVALCQSPTPPDTVTIPVSPVGWAAVVPCSRVR